MRIGVDSYSYHRLLGELRSGESDPGERLGDGGRAVLAEVQPLGVDVVALETCYLTASDLADLGSLVAAAAPMELCLSWGAPNGLCFGARPEALPDLLGWIDAAAAAGVALLRIVVAGPSLRGVEPVAVQIERTLEPLALAARRAGEHGLQLAVENHGDLTAAELEQLLDATGRPELGVCLDTANLLRLGDDVLAGTRRLAARTLIVHLKDIEAPTATTDPVAGPCSVAFGTGVIPLDGVLTELAAVGFSGPVCVEVAQLAPGSDERELVRDGVAWLRRFAPRAG